MKNTHISYIIIMLAVCAAGCGAGSPTTPLQIPTTVEYLGGDVTGDIAVLTANSITFAAKDADGNDADASDVTVTLTKPDGSSADSEYGSCAVSSENGSYIVCEGPDDLPSDVNPRVTYTFTDGASASVSAGKDDSSGTPLGEYTGLIVVSPETVESGAFTFTRLKEITGCQGSSISSNGAGWLFLACMEVISVGNGTIKVYWSNTGGATVLGPLEVTDAMNTNIIRAMKSLSGTGSTTASAVLAYNVSPHSMKIVEISGNADGTISFGNTYTQSNSAVYDVYYDTNGTVHILADVGDENCPYSPEDFIANAYYSKLSGGQLSTYSRINGTDCSVKATSHNEPKIAAAGSDFVHAVWRSIGDSGEADPSIIQMYVTVLSQTDGSIVQDYILTSPGDVSATTLWASGQDARVDKDGNLVVSWDESYVGGTAGGLGTNLSLFGDSFPFTSYLISLIPLPTTDIDSVIQISGTQVIPDQANDYHMYYRNSESVLYVLASLGSDGIMSQTTPIAISSAGNLATGFLDADADWSGKNFVTWQEQQVETGTQMIVLAMGTTTTTE